MQELGYLKYDVFEPYKYHGVLLWNEIAVDWLNLAISFGTFSCLGARIRARGLVSPLIVAKAMWFGIPDFCHVEEKLVGHCVEYREVRDGNDVQVGFRLVEVPMRGIKSSLSKGACQLEGVGWLG